MSNTHLPATFVKSVLQNGVGRYVGQLQRLTIKFCKSHGDSYGARSFIENDLLEWVRNNPGTVVYLKPRRHRTPRLTAEYLNRECVQIPIRNLEQEEICQWVEHLRSRSGVQIKRLVKYWHTETPSIQGIWTPFTNRDTKYNHVQYPCKELSQLNLEEFSATDRLLQIAEQLRAQGNVIVEEEQEGEKH